MEVCHLRDMPQAQGQVRTEGSMIYGPGLSRPRDGNIGLDPKVPISSLRLEGSIPSAELFRAFMSEYLPTEINQERPAVDGVTSLSWLESLSRNSKRGPLLNMALEALSLSFIGRKRGKAELEDRGNAYFSCVTQRLARVSTAEHSQVVDILGAATVLAIYQLYNCERGRFDSWIVHAQAAWKLLEEQGPEARIDRSLLCRIRTCALYDACGRRESTFLARPEWRRRVSKGRPFEHLLDIMLDVPCIQELSDKIVCGNYGSSQRQHLKGKFIDRFLETEARLQQCYTDFLSKQEACPFPNYPIAMTDIHLLQGSPDLISLFQRAINFPGRNTAQFLLLSWTGFVIIYSEMSTVMRQTNFSLAREDALLPDGSYGVSRTWFVNECNFVFQQWEHSPRTCPDFEKAAGVFANRICESVALCDKGHSWLSYEAAAFACFMGCNAIFQGPVSSSVPLVPDCPGELCSERYELCVGDGLELL
ncbi:hypothetical protein N7470_002016 [Penicillium chermesinum]|nr:hypothetical protein N7470_002016 [Penicillium chermesinum]